MLRQTAADLHSPSSQHLCFGTQPPPPPLADCSSARQSETTPTTPSPSSQSYDSATTTRASHCFYNTPPTLINAPHRPTLGRYCTVHRYSSSAVVSLGAGRGAATAVEWVSRGVICAGAADGTVQVFDVRKLDAPVAQPEQLGAGCIRSLRGGGGNSGKEVAVGTDGGWVRAFDLVSGSRLHPTVSTVPHTDSVRAVRWLPSAKGTLVSAGWDGVVATHDSVAGAGAAAANSV
jgi:WD40 repeat protein